MKMVLMHLSVSRDMIVANNRIGGNMGKILEGIVVIIGIVATIIGFFNFNLAIDILVKAIIIACFVAVLISLFSGKK